MKTAAFFLLALATASLIAVTDEPEHFMCRTDTECAMLCPQTEPDCDGGPQGKVE